MITAAYGLGENVVQGAVNPDEFLVFKPTLALGFRPIIRRHLGEKAIKMIYTRDPVTAEATRNVAVKKEARAPRSPSATTRSCSWRATPPSSRNTIRRHAGKPRPMDIEWAKDGVSGELFIVQARPETVHSIRSGAFTGNLHPAGTRPGAVTGKAVGAKIGTGKARTILEAAHMHDLKPGEVLVTDITDPDWEPVMKIASAIVTNRGGRVCHAAIVARELGIPAVVGANACDP